MAVPKTQKLGIRMAGCRQDRAYKDYTSNPISTSSFSMLCYTMRLLGTALMVKKRMSENVLYTCTCMIKKLQKFTPTERIQ